MRDKADFICVPCFDESSTVAADTHHACDQWTGEKAHVV